MAGGEVYACRSNIAVSRLCRFSVWLGLGRILIRFVIYVIFALPMAVILTNNVHAAVDEYAPEYNNISPQEKEALRQLYSIARRWQRFSHPGFYGGSYLGDDGHAVLHIVESCLEYAKADSFISGLLDDGIRYRLVEYSYRQLSDTLQAVSDAINARTHGLSHDSGMWCSYAGNRTILSVNVILNKLEIGLLDYNEVMIAGFRRYVYDSPMISFVQHDGFIFDMGRRIPVTVLLSWIFIIAFVGIVVIFCIRMARHGSGAYDLPRRQELTRKGIDET